MLRLAALILATSIVCPLAAQKAVPATRSHASSGLDLVTLDSAGTSKPGRYLGRAYLATLSQTITTLKPDENFPELPLTGVSISGINLDILLNSIDPSNPAAAIVAICRDGYTSPFPRPAIFDHHPILVLTVDGISPNAWAIKHHTYDPGPYFITYANFVPSFRILAHEDFPQHPAEIVRLKIVPSDQLFAAITPPDIDQFPSDSPVLAGLHIAQQNCFRCHNSGDTGGTKAHRTWQHLAEVAKTRPEHFAKWVHDPQSIDPKAKMTPNLQYDQPTLSALTRYFQTFAH